MNNKSLEEQFETKYDAYGEMLYRIAFLYLANSADAQDVLQDVFIKLLYDAPNFKDENHEKAWLIRVTQNRCKNILKSSARKNLPLDDVQLPSSSYDNDLKMDVSKQVIALPVKYKSAIILYYYNDYSVSEIAHILKISKSAVKMQLKRGRELLKIQLEDYSYEK
jgi:RNA polymerase sigma-70 factor (ECF subfamily)